MTKFTIRLKGGAGSGNFGHKGRPGEVGGSAPKDSASGNSKDSWRKTDKISWDGEDVFALNNKVKSYFTKYLDSRYTEEFGTEKKFYESVKSLLDRSSIELSDGEWDELGQYFDAWVPDKFEE